MTLKHITVSLLLVFAIGLSTWSILLSKQSSPILPDQSPNYPDAFLENVVAVIINSTGNPVLKIETANMVHYNEDDTTHMTQPFITVYRQDSPNPWYINADSGRAIQGTEQIIFKNNVIIRHPADEKNPTTTMKTNSLTIFPQKQLAETNEAVVITQPASTIHAVGMLANLNDGTVKLLSNMREEYVPSS